MQLFVYCHSNRHKFLIAYPALVRGDLPAYLHLTCPFDRTSDVYTPSEVQAEAANAAIPGAVIGGLIGIVGGPLGMILGGLLGGGVGARVQQEDVNRAQRFNSSH